MLHSQGHCCHGFVLTSAAWHFFGELTCHLLFRSSRALSSHLPMGPDPIRLGNLSFLSLTEKRHQEVTRCACVHSGSQRNLTVLPTASISFFNWQRQWANWVGRTSSSSSRVIPRMLATVVKRHWCCSTSKYFNAGN